MLSLCVYHGSEIERISRDARATSIGEYYKVCIPYLTYK